MNRIQQSLITPDNVDAFLDYLQYVLVPLWNAEATPSRLPAEEWEFLRKAALERDGYSCGNCGKSNLVLQVHHIIEIQNGGSNRLTNLRTLCNECHALNHPWM
jgi:5-methylcytosine-specific restriction endonuclease McrA